MNNKNHCITVLANREYLRFFPSFYDQLRNKGQYTGDINLLTDNIESQEGPTAVVSWSEMNKDLAVELLTDEINFEYKDELERAINVYGQTDLEKYL